MAFIITLSQDKINRRQQELGWDMFELSENSNFTNQECKALFIKTNKLWQFKPFGKDTPLTFTKLTPIINGINKLAESLNYKYKDLIKIYTDGQEDLTKESRLHFK